MEDIYTRSPFGRELEISCRAFTYRAGGRSKQDRSTVFRVKRVSAAEKTPLCSAATRNRCNKDSWSITSAGISQCDEKDRPRARKFQKRATSPSPRGKIGTVLKFSLNSSPSIDKSARFLNKINERIVLWLEKGGEDLVHVITRPGFTTSEDLKVVLFRHVAPSIYSHMHEWFVGGTGSFLVWSKK